jgi:hypothetical protein
VISSMGRKLSTPESERQLYPTQTLWVVVNGARSRFSNIANTGAVLNHFEDRRRL